MTGSLMLINPRARSRKRKTAKRRATARRRHNPIAANPKRRRTHARRRHNPIGLARVHRTRRHARRRNPIAGLGNIGSLVLNGLKGAAGGVVVNAVTNFLPATFRTGNVLYVSRAALAIVLGTVGAKVVGRHARPMAEGALAINFADLINSFGGGMLPGSQLHGVNYGQMGEIPANMGALVDNTGTGTLSGFGETYEQPIGSEYGTL